MSPERRESLQKTQRICIVAQVVMAAVYILAGVLMFMVNGHCAADIPIYVVGAVIAAGCMAALAVFESRLSKKLAG